MAKRDAASKVESSAPAVGRHAGTVLRVAGVAAIALTVANCAQSGKTSSRGGGGIDPKYGVAASPRVVEDGQPVPKGGGRQLVGKPYVVAGKTYVPRESPEYAREGLASWYGVDFHGRMTANGEVFDRHSIAAAHTTMPLPSYARVTNVENGHSIIVRVNDRGPYHANRIIDVSERTAEALDFRRKGTARVRVEYVGRASVNGSDDRILLASLRTDGAPAGLSPTGPTQFAQAAPRPSDLPREAIALRSYEVEEPEVAPAPAQAAVPALAPAAERAASGIPLPPERPYDLGTIPNAATPVTRSSAVSVLPPARPQVAGLYYAAPAEPASFQRGRAFSSLDRSAFSGSVKR